MRTWVFGWLFFWVSHAAWAEILPPAELRIGDGTVWVEFKSEKISISREKFLENIRIAADSVARYYHRLPVPRVLVTVSVRKNSKTIFASEHGGREIRVLLGDQVTESYMASDWTLTHEMVHLAFPDLDRKYRWIEEGLATYVEPVARARVGRISAESVWQDLFDRLPEGLGKAGDPGLNEAKTYSRIYWGGALYWFLADLEIRKRTQGAKSIQDVLIEILKQGGSGKVHWTLHQLFRVMRNSTGTDLFEKLYERLGPKSSRFNLQEIWTRLGVSKIDGKLVLGDHAPETKLRLGVTAAAP